MMSKKAFIQRLNAVAAVFLLGFGVAGSSLGAANAPVIQGAGVIARIEVLGEGYGAEDRQSVVDQARIVFYRPGNDTGPAASVFVNGVYHATVVPGGYSPICLQPQSVRLGVALAGIKVRPAENEVVAFDTSRGQTLYLRVRETEPGQWRLQPVSEAEAQAELAGNRLQIHTVSRVQAAEICRFPEEPKPVSPQPEAAAAQPAASHTPALRRVVLSGGQLFHYARGDWAGLTPAGMAELDKLAFGLRQEYEHIDRLAVIGYTDPLGKNHIPISRQRAETVLSYFQRREVRARETRAEGRGPADLVVSDCGRQPTPAVIACNEPNRRVVVEVSGVRR